MTETSYVITLTPDRRNRYGHYHLLEKKKVVEFRVQYEAYIQGKWHTIVRYNTAHGFAHRDVMHPDRTETKTSFHHWDYAEVLTYGERDLKQNWASYRKAYEREFLKLQKIVGETDDRRRNYGKKHHIKF
jgi:hypothetical protein